MSSSISGFSAGFRMLSQWIGSDFLSMSAADSFHLDGNLNFPEIGMALEV